MTRAYKDYIIVWNPGERTRIYQAGQLQAWASDYLTARAWIDEDKPPWPLRHSTVAPIRHNPRP